MERLAAAAVAFHTSQYTVTSLYTSQQTFSIRNSAILSVILVCVHFTPEVSSPDDTPYGLIIIVSRTGGAVQRGECCQLVFEQGMVSETEAVEAWAVKYPAKKNVAAIMMVAMSVYVCFVILLTQ